MTDHGVGMTVEVTEPCQHQTGSCALCGESLIRHDERHGWLNQNEPGHSIEPAVCNLPRARATEGPCQQTMAAGNKCPWPKEVHPGLHDFLGALQPCEAGHDD